MIAAWNTNIQNGSYVGFLDCTAAITALIPISLGIALRVCKSGLLR